MEFIINTSQFENMIDNKIIGMPKLKDSKINFFGKNNILVFDNDIELNNATLNFKGNNSLVFLGSDLKENFNLNIYNDSTGFIGKDVTIGVSISIDILENQNVVIGDDCVIGNNTYISNSDGFLIYDINSKKRINFSNSIYIGDHVFLGNNVYVSKGAKIGSGSIIDHASFIPSYSKIPSNTFLSGNPIKIIRKEVFFTHEFSGVFNIGDSLNSKSYKSDIFIFQVSDKETLSLTQIDQVLSELNVNDRHDFVNKLFIHNKRKNRFSIHL